MTSINKAVSWQPCTAKSSKQACIHAFAHLAIEVFKELSNVRECNRVMRERLVAISKIHVDVQSIAGNAPCAECVRCGI